jgi:hypothetical protein
MIVSFGFNCQTVLYYLRTADTSRQLMFDVLSAFGTVGFQKELRQAECREQSNFIFTIFSVDWMITVRIN